MSVNPRGLDEDGLVEETIEPPAKGWIEWVSDAIDSWIPDFGQNEPDPPPADEPVGVK